MGRPFNLKFDNIVWETNMDHLQAWKDGKTGYPIVDAVSPSPTYCLSLVLTASGQAMRALKYEGYMHVGICAIVIYVPCSLRRSNRIEYE
jgi:hypothetical protein